MDTAAQLWFGEWRVDLGNEQLWRGQEAYPLPPKVFALLRALLERPGQLVTKAELFQAVWSGTVVGDAVLTVAVGELRKSLGDDPRTPRFIETVHRRGYRFLAPVTTASPSSGTPSTGEPPAISLLGMGPPRRPASQLVGRTQELQQLRLGWERARRGERHLTFVTGEPGIGKTAVVDAFVEEILSSEALWLGQGQCIEHYGAGEAYLPVLDALGQLCRGPESAYMMDLLRRQAPTWLVQLPGVLAPADLESLQRLTLGVTRERMLREMAEALEAVTAHRPLVLVLEDLHWSDHSTVELLAFLARRRQPARLLVIGTYRPVELVLGGHPLKGITQELQVHGHCQELALGLLTREAIEEFLAQRLPNYAFPPNFSRVLHARTEGNPLFLENLLQDWLHQGVLTNEQGQWTLQGTLETVANQVPQSLRLLLEQQFTRLSVPVLQFLEIASLVGEEFSAALVAAGSGAGVVEVEEQCEDLARRDYVLQGRGTAEWPDGTVATRYGFLHALYREVFAARVPAARRVQLHWRLAERLEAAYGEHAAEVSAELAVHFAQGRAPAKAIRYRELAAQRALGRHAYQEVIQHATMALTLLSTQPETPERWQQELACQLSLATAFRVIKGYGAEETLQALLRTQELCEQLDAQQQLFVVRLGLIGVYIVRTEFYKARALGEQVLDTAERQQDLLAFVAGHTVLGVTLFQLGELTAAHAHLTQSLALYEPRQHGSFAVLVGQDFSVSCSAYDAYVLWLLGHPDQAAASAQAALTRARELAHPFSEAIALSWGAHVHIERRGEHAVQEWSDEALRLSSTHGFSDWQTINTAVHGWALIKQGHVDEGSACMHQSLTTLQAAGTELWLPYLLALLVEARKEMGQVDEGLKMLAEALSRTDKSGERFYEAELYRLKGELLLKRAGRRLIPQKRKK